LLDNIGIDLPGGGFMAEASDTESHEITWRN